MMITRITILAVAFLVLLSISAQAQLTDDRGFVDDPNLIPDLETNNRISYSINTKTTKLTENIYSMTIYSYPNHIFEDGIWKPIEKAKSLMKIDGLNFILEDPNFQIKILDFNYTNVKFRLSVPKALYGILLPISIYSKNNSINPSIVNNKDNLTNDLGPYLTGFNCKADICTRNIVFSQLMPSIDVDLRVRNYAYWNYKFGSGSTIVTFGNRTGVNYTGTQDTFLATGSLNAANLNYGINANLYAGYYNLLGLNFKYRSLIEFDFDTFQNNYPYAIIDSVNLTLFAYSKDGAATHILNVTPVLMRWGYPQESLWDVWQGAHDGLGIANEPTWNYRTHLNESWNSNGSSATVEGKHGNQISDYNSTADIGDLSIATITTSTTGEKSWIFDSLGENVLMFQKEMKGYRYGFRLSSNQESTWNLYYFYSSDSANANKPKLTVYFTVYDPIIVNYPQNQTYSSQVLSLIVTSNQSSDTCYYNINGGQNYTMSEATSTSWYSTFDTEADGLFNARIYCNKSDTGLASYDDSIWFSVNSSIINFLKEMNATIMNKLYLLQDDIANLNNISVEEIWSYYNRTLTDFNYIEISNYVWNHTDRNLTYYEDVTEYLYIQSLIWNASNRNLTYYPSTDYDAVASYIWNYSARNLTYYQDMTEYLYLQSLVWNASSRNLTFYPAEEAIDYQLIQSYVWNASDRNLTHYEDMTQYLYLQSLIWNSSIRNLTYYQTTEIDYASISDYVWNRTERNLTYYQDVAQYLYLQNLIWNASNRTLSDFSFIVSINDTNILQYLTIVNSTAWDIFSNLENTPIISSMDLSGYKEDQSFGVNINIYATIINGFGERYDPDHINISIFNPLWNKTITNATMVRNETGVYYYSFILNSTEAYGSYLAIIGASEDNAESISGLVFVVTQDGTVVSTPVGEPSWHQGSSASSGTYSFSDLRKYSVYPLLIETDTSSQTVEVEVENTGIYTLGFKVEISASLINILSASPLEFSLIPGEKKKVELMLSPKNKDYEGYINIRSTDFALKSLPVKVDIKIKEQPEVAYDRVTSLFMAMASGNLPGGTNEVMSSLGDGIFQLPNKWCVPKFIVPVALSLLLFGINFRRKKEEKINKVLMIISLFLIWMISAFLIPSVPCRF